MPKQKKKSSKATGGQRLFMNDTDRSVEDWGQLTAEILRLKCNQYGVLATGNKACLQTRLYEHFQPGSGEDLPPAPSSAVASTNEDENMVSDEAEDAVGTPPEGENTVIPQARASNKANGDGNQGDIGLVLAEMRAFRSDFVAVKKKQDGILREINHIKASSTQSSNSTHTQAVANTPIAIDNLVNQLSPFPLLQQQPQAQQNPQFGFTLPPFYADNNTSSGFQGLNAQGQGMDNNNIYANANDSSYVNPFVPPGIKSTVLKKIEKREFLDLEDVAPASLQAKKKQFHSSASAFCDVDSETSILTLKERSKKGTISNLSEWMRAWNIYAQASLHFRPNMFFQLFKYQQIFVEQTCKYKFEACYNYEKEVRLLIASQAALAPSQRTAVWDSFNEEVANAYLRDNLLPTCHNCKATSHHQAVCPLKPDNTRTNYQEYQHNFRQQQTNLPFFRPNYNTNRNMQGSNYNNGTPQPQAR